VENLYQIIDNWIWEGILSDRLEYDKEDLKLAYPELTDWQIDWLYNFLRILKNEVTVTLKIPMEVIWKIQAFLRDLDDIAYEDAMQYGRQNPTEESDLICKYIQTPIVRAVEKLGFDIY